MAGSMDLGGAWIEIAGNLKPWNAAVATAKSSTLGLVKWGGHQGKRFASAFFTPFTTAAHRAAQAYRNSLLIGVAGGVGGIAYTVKAASDLNESINKNAVAFGRFAKIVTDDAAQMAKDFGVPQKQFIDAASSIGLIGKSSGLSQEDAAKLGSQFAKLAADTASFYNIPVSEALEKIEAGLVGEIRPLRELGVLLSEDALKSEAFNEGIAQGASELSDAQKVQARAVLIQRGLKDANGDLARTYDALANRLREVWGRAQNVAAEFGQHLLPVAKELATAFVDLARGASEWIKQHADTIREWADAAQNLVKWFRVLIANRGTVGEIFTITIEHWKSVVGELFSWMGKNLAELARYFARVLAHEVQNAFRGIINTFGNRLGLPAIAAAAPVPAPRFAPLALGRGIPGLEGPFARLQQARQQQDLTDAQRNARDLLVDWGRRLSETVRGPLTAFGRSLLADAGRAQFWARQREQFNRNQANARAMAGFLRVHGVAGGIPPRQRRFGPSTPDDLANMVLGGLFGGGMGFSQAALMAARDRHGRPLLRRPQAPQAQPEFGGGETFGFADFARQIQQNIGGRDDTLRRVASATEEARDLQVQMRDSLTAIQRAAGPPRAN